MLDVKGADPELPGRNVEAARLRIKRQTRCVGGGLKGDRDHREDGKVLLAGVGEVPHRDARRCGRFSRDGLRAGDERDLALRIDGQAVSVEVEHPLSRQELLPGPVSFQGAQVKGDESFSSLSNVEAAVGHRHALYGHGERDTFARGFILDGQGVDRGLEPVSGVFLSVVGLQRRLGR